MSRSTFSSRPFLLVWAFTFLTFFAAFQLFPTAPLRLREMGASLAESGRFLSVFTVGSSLGALVTGQMADRLGHRRMMVATSTIFLAIMGAYAFVPVRWAFYLLAPVHGAVWSGLITSTVALLGGILPEEGRAEGMSWYGLASPLGVVFGPTVGVWIHGHWGFRAMCLLLVLCFAVLNLLARSLPPDAPRAAHERPPFQPPDRAVLALASVLFCIAFSYGALTSYSTQEALKLGLRWPSAFLSCLALGMLLMRIAMGVVGFGPRPARLLPWMLLLAVAGMAVMGLARGGLPRHVSAALLFGAGYSMVYTLLNSELLEVVPAERRGAAFGTFMFAFDAGIGLGSLALGALIGARGYAWGWCVGGLLALAGLPLTLRVARGGKTTLAEGR